MAAKNCTNNMCATYGSSKTRKSGRIFTNGNLQSKWDAMNYENHKYNLRTAKHNIDNTAPKTFLHLYYRPKWLKEEIERFCSIQRNNKLLMDRLAFINKKGAWIDNKNDYKIKSLNAWKRQQEMIEIASRNQAIYQRLLKVQSVYNVNKMEDDYLLHLKFEANISKFPKDWRSAIEHLNLMKRDLRKKIIRKRTGKRYIDHETNNMAREKYAREAKETHTKETEETKVKDEKLKDREQRLQKMQEQKRQKEEWKLESKRWREAREERIRLAKERLEEENKLEREAKMKEEGKQKRRHLKKKMEVEEWKQKKKVEEEAEEDKCKALAKEEKQGRVQGARKRIESGKERPISAVGKDDRPKKIVIVRVFVSEKKGVSSETVSDASAESFATKKLLKENEGDEYLTSAGNSGRRENIKESSSVDNCGKETEEVNLRKSENQ